MEPCCQDETNRVLTESKGDLTIMQCQVCLRRHFELTIDPGIIGLRGAAV